MTARYLTLGLLMFAASCMLCLHADAQAKTFYLRDTRTLQEHGPFVYEDMSRITIGATTYQIRVTRTGRAFTISTPTADRVFGPFQFVSGRILTIGGTGMELTRVDDASRQPAPPPVFVPPGNVEETLPPDTLMQLPPPGNPNQPFVADNAPLDFFEPEPAASAFSAPANVEAGIVWEPFTETAYDQGIHGASPTYDLTIDRHIISAYLKRSGFSLGLGYIPRASWSDILLAAAAANVDDAEIGDGSGYAARLAYEHTVYSSGAWDVEVFGNISYIHEEYDVGFVTSERSMQTVVGTNGVVTTNVVRSSSDQMSDTLELNETTARLGAKALYVADPWRAYAGASVVIFDDVDVSTSIHVGEGNTRIKLDRAGLVSGFLGGSVDLYGCRAFAEYMYGDASGFRLGVARRF